MRLELVRGRLLSPADTAGNPKATVISESYARQLFGSENPIGRAIDYHEPVTVVGVVRDVRYAGLDKEPFPAIYLPVAQWPSELMCVVARTAPNAGDLGPAVRAAVRAIDSAQPVMNLTTIDRIISESVADRRFYTTATSAFAMVALLLTTVGLVVIVSRSVVERQRELAIRAALGATTSRLVRLVMRQGLVPVVAGAGLGIAAASAGASLLDQFLFHVTSREPGTYAGVGLLIVAVAAVATFVPARRVADTEPAGVLRAE
jgi:putative ABC transport system permease protein